MNHSQEQWQSLALARNLEESSLVSLCLKISYYVGFHLRYIWVQMSLHHHAGLIENLNEQFSLFGLG